MILRFKFVKIRLNQSLVCVSSYIAFAVAAREGTNCLSFEPFAHVAGMPSMFAHLAPQEPLVKRLVKVLWNPKILILHLHIPELDHGVEHSDCVKTNCARRQRLLAINTLVDHFLVIATRLV